MTTCGILNTPGRPMMKQTWRYCSNFECYCSPLSSYLSNRVICAQNSFVQRLPLNQCALVVSLLLTILLIQHTFCWKEREGKRKRGQEGKNKEKKKAGREGRKKVLISWSMNLSVQLRHCMMKSESQIFRYEDTLNATIIPVNEEIKRVFTWIVKGLATERLCHSKYLFSIWKMNQ